jgi:hypothetical protein
MRDIKAEFIGDEQRAEIEGDGCSGNELSHNEYRALVMRQASKLGNGNPNSKHFFAAKSAVDRSLGRIGVSIMIPGARPGRKTM